MLIKNTQLYSLKGGHSGLKRLIANLEKLCRELNVSEETKLDLFIQGVNPNLKQRLLLSQPATDSKAVIIARVKNSFINDDDERIVETVVKAMAKLQTKPPKTNDIPPINAYIMAPANLANPENATREVARLRQQLKQLKLRLSKQQTENQATPQNNYPILQNQPTCYKCHNEGHMVRNCDQAFRDPRIPLPNNPTLKFSNYGPSSRKSDINYNSNWSTPQQNSHKNSRNNVMENNWQYDDRRYNDRRYDQNVSNNMSRFQTKPQHFNKNPRQHPPLNVFGSRCNPNTSYDEDLVGQNLMRPSFLSDKPMNFNRPDSKFNFREKNSNPKPNPQAISKTVHDSNCKLINDIPTKDSNPTHVPLVNKTNPIILLESDQEDLELTTKRHPLCLGENKVFNCNNSELSPKTIQLERKVQINQSHKSSPVFYGYP